MPWQRDDDPHNPENRNAGNGGDVVKHVVYATLLDVLLERPPWRDELRLRECHAGRGAYRIDADDPRRRLGDALRAGHSRLRTDQRRALTAMGLPDDGSWYAGSAALNATHLARAPGAHRYEGYEWAPDTRAILRGALAEAVGDRLPVRLPGDDHPGARFDGETHIARSLPAWDRRDVILLDPFGVWRRPKLAHRRRRYRAIVEAYLARGTQAPPLTWFFVWSNAEAGRGDRSSPRIADGYGELGARLLGAGRAPLLVRWRWDLSCAMWILVPQDLRDALRAALEANLDEVASASRRAGVGPDALDVGWL